MLECESCNLGVLAVLSLATNNYFNRVKGIKMKKIIITTILASSALTVTATENDQSDGWVGGINYMSASVDSDVVDITLGAVVGSIGYKIKIGNVFYLVPEFRAGMGISDDSVNYQGVSVKFELDRFMAFSLRGQFELSNGMYFLQHQSMPMKKLPSLPLRAAIVIR